MRHMRDDATRWVWIVFGLVQATITMLMAFDVLNNLEVPQAITAVTLVVYVAVNELWAKPHRDRQRDPETDAAWTPTVVEDAREDARS